MSAELIGKQIECGFAVEETRGTAPATATKWAKNITANVLEKAEYANDEASRGVFEDMDGRRVVKKHIEGDIEQPLYADAVGYLLYNLYGAVSSSLVGGGVYDHIFTVEQNAISPSLALYMKDGEAQQVVYQNTHINTLELTGAVDDYVKLTASFIGKDAVDNTDTPSYDTEYDFVGKEITVKIADDVAGLSSATPLCLKDLAITFDKGLIADHCLGSYTPSDIYKSKMSIEGSFSKNFEDEAFKDLYLGNGTKVMEIKIEGEASIGTTYHPTITLRLYKVQITNWERSGGKDELVSENIEFKAYYSATDSKQSQLTLRNLTTEYEVEVSA